MKKFLTGGFAVALVTVMLVAGGTTSASAGTGHKVGGGTWNYWVDVNNMINYSGYHHPTAYHRSSVQNGNGLVRDYANAGSWTHAEQPATMWGNTASWWKA